MLCPAPLVLSVSMAGESGSSSTICGGHRPHSTMEMRPLGSRCCSSGDRALMPCFHEMFTAAEHNERSNQKGLDRDMQTTGLVLLPSLPKLNIIPFVCGKYILVPVLALRKASSRVAPKETPTVMF